jgi:acyl-[acyl-carrier-protein]-phospholipid O-acyltransferase/long-chain-fatty-acid--[acyl-carrier-protein] ligase
MKRLLDTAGTAPFVAAVFLNAFVDLGHKIVIQNTVFEVYDGQTQIVLTALVNGLILLPFVALLSPAGFIGDRYPKNQVLRIAAWVAVGLTLGITACYYLGWFELAFAMTFFLAVQSAFYSPAKYGYIKPLFGKESLGFANGIVQAATIVAILAGTLVFSLLFVELYRDGAAGSAGILRAIAPLGWLLVATATLELLMMYRLPTLEHGDPESRFDWVSYRRGQLLRANLAAIKDRPVIRLSIIGLATFWSVGQVMLAAFPTYAESRFGVTNPAVIQGILACSGVGIVVGSGLAARSSRHHIETGLIPLGALGIALGLWLLPGAGTTVSQALIFTFVGAMGGMFIVPLNALIQFSAGAHEMGRILAVNNWVQNVAMTAFLVLTAAVALAGFDSLFLLGLITLVAVLGGMYTVYKLPQSLVRYVIATLLKQHYRVNVQGLKNVPEQGGVLLLGNHISWVDWAIVQIACPRRVRFVMTIDIFGKWYLRGFLKAMGCIPIQASAASRGALATVAAALDQGDVVCLFPEGTISRSGHLADFRHGYERACQDTQRDDIAIIPFYLRGLWGSQFSRASRRMTRNRRSGFKRDLIVAFGAPLAKNTPADVLKRRVFDLSISSWQAYVDDLPVIPKAWIDAAKRTGGGLSIADSLAGDLSGIEALTGAICLARRIGTERTAQNVGLLLPTSSAGMLANMAALLAGKTAVNLNYTASAEALASAVSQAEIRTVYTSRRFLDKLAQRGADLSSLLAKVRVVHVEGLRDTIGKRERLATWLMVRCLPASLLSALVCRARDPQSTAAILFSSGSEGLPKGVMLSHRNIMANVKQVSDVLNLQDEDVIMASLPLFHAFGLTVTQFMPLIEGVPLVCHPDPTDAAGIAKAVARYRATVLCGTSTFLRLFVRSRKVHPLMLQSLRIVVAGAERLNPEVRASFQAKFGKTVYEGYGCTETTPVASVNLPDQIDPQFWKVQIGSRQGTVGMPLPGTSFKIVDPQTFAEVPTGADGMILIGGPQVMQGYLENPEKTAEAIKTLDGTRWYVTGDKGALDEQGFLTIRDRYSRFAKLGGEIVSLSAVEQAVRNSLDNPEQELVAVNLEDEQKGETIVLLHEAPLESDRLRRAMLDAGCNPLMIPSTWIKVDKVPKLGSGKTDFAAAKSLARRMITQPEPITATA